jgi:hypothetical protein
MKRSKNGQEIIVLGSGLGGLLAGTLLAKNNHSVLLLKEKGYQPSHAIKGYRFVPFSSISEKRFKPSLLKKISQALNLPSHVDSKEEEKQAKICSGQLGKKGTFQVILPKARIDICSQRCSSREEWKREFPKEVVHVERFYDELDKTQHFLQKLNSKKNAFPFFPIRERSLIKNIFLPDPVPKEEISPKLSSLSKEFKEFVKLQLVSWGNLYSDQFSTSFAGHILLDEMNELAPHFDLEKLEEEILKQFLGYGGRVEEIDRVEKVEISRRKGQTLSMNRDRMVFRSNSLIFNSSLHRISSSMGKKGKRMLKWQEKIKPLYVMIPIFLGIREKVIPVGMKDLLISILDLEKPYQDGNVLFLSLSPKGDETQAPEGNRALTVESLMGIEQWEKTLLVDYQRSILKHLYSLFPFLESHIDFIDFQWAIENIPRWSYSHFLYGATSDFDWRGGVVPVKLLKNVYFVGKENFPYLGVEGEVFAGLMVAQQILKKYS